MRTWWLPREHGAWAELGLPLLTGLSLAPASVAGVCLAIAAFALFMAHEPWLLARGQRGGRLRRSLGPAARRLVAGWLALALGAGGVVLLTLPGYALGWLGLPVGLGGLAGWIVWRGQEKGLAGELVIAVTLAALAAPLVASGGARPAAILAVVGLWAGLFVGATLAVRALFERGSDPWTGARMRPVALGGGGILAGLGLGTGLAGGLPGVVLGVAAVPLGLGLLAVLSRWPPRRLPQLGIALVLTQSAVAIAVIATFPF